MRTGFNLPLTLAASLLALGLGVLVGRGSTVGGTQRVAVRSVPEATATATAQIKRYMVPVSKTQPSLGPEDALVTIVEWCDLPDPACARVEPALQAVLSEHKDLVRLMFRHYGQPGHESSAIAHQFLRAVFTVSDKFWQARALLLAHPGEVTRADLERYSHQLGVHWSAVTETMTSPPVTAFVTADRVFANMFEVKSVPALFVNGRPLGPNPSAAGLSRLVDEELRAAVELVAHGIAKGDVYAEVIKHADWKRVKVEP